MTPEERANDLRGWIAEAMSHGTDKFSRRIEWAKLLYEQVRTAQREAWLAGRDAAAGCADARDCHIAAEDIRALPVPAELCEP